MYYNGIVIHHSWVTQPGIWTLTVLDVKLSAWGACSKPKLE